MAHIPKPFARPSISVVPTQRGKREWVTIPPYLLSRGDIVAERGQVVDITVFVEHGQSLLTLGLGQFVVEVTFQSGQTEAYNGFNEEVFAFTARQAEALTAEQLNEVEKIRTQWNG